MKSPIELAVSVAEFGTCSRRKIGAVALLFNGDTVSACNGRPSQLGSCLENPCPGASVPAGAGNADCRGIHAEERLFMLVGKGKIKALYSTKAPCTGCTLKAIEHGVQEIYFLTPSNETKNSEIADSAGLVWKQVCA